jgi:hypothetical protein
MECFGTTDFDNNNRLITLSVIIISGVDCIYNISRLRVKTSLVTEIYIKINSNAKLFKMFWIDIILFRIQYLN